MSSTVLCSRQGSISVSRKDVLDDLVSSNGVHTAENKENISGHNNYASVQNASQNASDNGDGTEDVGRSVFCRSWLCPESVHRLQTESDPDCRIVTSWCDGILQTEEQYSEDVSGFLDDCDLRGRRRQELQHRKWIERVYDPIQERIKGEINSNGFSHLLQWRRRMYDNYLEECNRKGQVFIDAEGMPADKSQQLERPLQLCAKLSPLNDPLLNQVRLRTLEDSIAVRCQTGVRLTSAELEGLRLPPLPLKPIGRHGTTWPDWQTMHNYQIESTTRQTNRKKMHPNKNGSQIKWCNYYTSCEPEIVAKELEAHGLRPRGARHRSAPASLDGKLSRTAVTPVAAL